MQVMMKHNIRSDGDKISEWILGMASLCGIWPFTRKVTRIERFNSVKITTCDSIRLLIMLAIYLGSFCFELRSDFLESFAYSSIEVKLSWSSLFISLLNVTASIALGVCNRQKLLRIILINLDFDRKASRRKDIIYIFFADDPALQMQSIGQQIDHRIFQRGMIFYVGVNFIISYAIFAVYLLPNMITMGDTTSNIHGCIIFLMTFSGVVLQCLYWYLLMNIFMRFRLLNALLR